MSCTIPHGKTAFGMTMTTGNTYYLSGVNIMKQTPDGTQTVLVARPFLLNLFQTRGLLWAFGFLAMVTLLVLQEYFY